MESDSILEALARAGFLGRALPVSRLSDMARDITIPLSNGQLDPDLFREFLARFTFGAPGSFPEARYVIVVSVPQPKVLLTFHWKNLSRKLVVPPTYANYSSLDSKVKEVLIGTCIPDEKRFVKAILPYKTLAARAGLVKYGKNNVTYAPGFGSHHRLTAFFTDMEIGMDHWQEREALPECDGCDKCLKACPTGAIRGNRFMIEAQRCLTYLNEKPSDVPFPNTLRSSAHNALMGCMICQDICPANKGNHENVLDGDEFSEEETEYLLTGEFQGERADEMAGKLDRSGVDLSIFPRNLKVLLE